MSRELDEAKAKADLIKEITPEVRKEWFVDYGTKNMWGQETWDKYLVSLCLHERDKAEQPEMHTRLPQKYHWRCWEESNCSCGFCSSCDSSD